MSTIEDLILKVSQLKQKVLDLTSENASMRSKLGIRRFLNPKNPDKDTTEQMDSSGSNPSVETVNSAGPSESKPPPFFVSGIRSISVFNALIAKHGVDIGEMKALQKAHKRVSANEQTGTHFSQWCESSLPKDQELVARSFALYDAVFGLSHRFRNYPPSGTELQKIAIASTNLLFKLPLMEDVNNILFDSAWYVAHNADTSEKLSNEDLQASREKKMLEKIESTISSDASLTKLYKEELQKAAKKLAEVPLGNSYFPLTMRQIILKHSSEKCFENDLNAKYTKHRIGFGPKFEEREKTVQEKCQSFQRHLLAQALFRLAKTTLVDQVQKQLDEAIQTTDKKLERIADIGSDSVFFPMMGEQFKKNAELDGEVTKIKNELMKKYKIEFTCEQYETNHFL